MKKLILIFTLILLGTHSGFSASPNYVKKEGQGQTRTRRDILGPVKQLEVRGHSKSIVQYRSAKKAFFLSLALPGAGQLYVGGMTKNYVKAAAFATVEAAMIGGWYYYSIHKYSEKSKEARQYADTYFNAFQYDSLTVSRYLALDEQYQRTQFSENYLGSRREGYCRSVYGSDNYTANDCNDFSGERISTHLTHVKYQEFVNPEDLYGKIESSVFILGWQDVQSSNQQLYSGNPLGVSTQYQTYLQYRNDAREFEKLRTYFFVGTLINHVVSAIDALISAQANNALLYDGDMVWYQRLHMQSATYFDQQELVTDLNVALRF